MKTLKELLEETKRFEIGSEDPMHDFSNEDYHNFKKLNNPHQHNSLSNHETRYLGDYAGSGYSAVNDYHRGMRERYFEKNPYTVNGIKNKTKHLDSAIGKHITLYDAHVWRGITHKLKAKKGDIIQDKGYTSTSFRPNAAMAFLDMENNLRHHLIHIKIPAYSRAVYMHHNNSSEEQEVLLPRGSKFKYLGKEKHPRYPNITIHHLEHIPEES